MASAIWRQLVASSVRPSFSNPIAFCAASAGFWFAGLPASVIPWPGLVAPFLFFRLFDIWKPGPVDAAQRLPGGWGVVLDDVVAGLLAALLVWPIDLGLRHLG